MLLFLRSLILLPGLFVVGWAFGVGNSRVFVSTPVSDHPKRTVQDCMSPAIPVLRTGMSVDETMNMLLENGLEGATVVDDNSGAVVGIVSSYDLIQREAFEGALLPMDGTAENVS